MGSGGGFGYGGSDGEGGVDVPGGGDGDEGGEDGEGVLLLGALVGLVGSGVVQLGRLQPPPSHPLVDPSQHGQ